MSWKILEDARKRSNGKVKAQLMSRQTRSSKSREKTFVQTQLCPQLCCLQFTQRNETQLLAVSSFQYWAYECSYKAERASVGGTIKAWISEGGVSSLLTAHPSTEQATGWIKGQPWDEVASPGLSWPGWGIPGKALIEYLNKPLR